MLRFLLIVGAVILQQTTAFTALQHGRRRYVASPSVATHMHSNNENVSNVRRQHRHFRLESTSSFAFKGHRGNDDDAAVAGSDIHYMARPSSLRRDVLRDIAATAAAGVSSAILLGHPSDNNALAAASETQLAFGTPGRPVLIIGGNGRTGMQVAESLASGGCSGGQVMNVVVTTRSGKDPFSKIKLPADTMDHLAFYPSKVDVRDLDSVIAAMKETNAGAVVYAASASKSGGNAAEVDGTGPANVAKAVKSTTDGAKLVLISALALDRPESKSYQITNTMGGFIDKIMDEKLRGEDEVRTIMGGRGKGNYVIIRPGPLLSGKTKNGASDLELNQGDTIGGGLSRDELAGVVVGALQSGVRGVTVECYRTKTATALQTDFVLPSGNELKASTYAGLFEGAEKDA